ncbi:MAG: nucleoside monophosphate kinase [Candidatus Pacebacteria bacterium]|nr:nucleoside monophosphate kinase [Candidatus Paceibacterota bacterium]
MAKTIDFPIFKTKTPGVTGKYDFSDPVARQAYFEAKAGNEIERLKKFFAAKGTFIAYLLAKKAAGKGTYARMLVEIFSPDYLVHLSVGDIVRSVDEEVSDQEKRADLEKFLKSHYRGYQSVEGVFADQKNRDTKGLSHSAETILALLEREISRLGKKSFLIDGFPRNLDQVSYSLFFRQLVGYRDDPDFFALIQIPESVIDARMKNRVVCPRCQLSRSLMLLPTKEVGYDEEAKEFFLKCENPDCRGERLMPKEGDNLGIENIRDRLDRDEELVRRALDLYGVPKVLLRNAIPVDQAREMVDDYELTPEYYYHWDPKLKKVTTLEKPWIIKDDAGIDSYSLLAPAVVVSFIKQMAETLGV